MRKYYYKKFNYGQAMEAWLVKHHEQREWLYEVFQLPSDFDWNQASPELIHTMALSNSDCYSMPRKEIDYIKPGNTYVDIVTGPPTAVKLLLHVSCPRKCPENPIRDIIHSHKAKHTHRGPYHHMLKINIYCDEMRLWDTHFKQLEVDLWQNTMVEKVLEEVKALLAEVRTCVPITKVFRYCACTKTK